MAGYWARRAEKKRRAAEIRKETDREIKSVKDAVAANKAAVKAFLKEYKKTHSKEEYKAKSDFYNKQLKQNDKWAKLKVAQFEAENKGNTMFSVGAVEDKVSKFYAWRLGRAQTAVDKKREAVADYLYDLMNKDGALRGDQIDGRDLSFVTMHNWDDIPQTTVEAVKEALLAQEAATAQPEAEVEQEEVEDREEEVEFVRERVDYQREVENHVDGPMQAVVQEDELESEASKGGADWIVLSDSDTHTSDLDSVESDLREQKEENSVDSESVSSDDWSSEISTEDLELE
ncbi:MAG: hypothetical protein IJX49_04450 [Clostridia bacterium]|nr:hypothetical protein [Clostridia bacterium]